MGSEGACEGACEGGSEGARGMVDERVGLRKHCVARATLARFEFQSTLVVECMR